MNKERMARPQPHSIHHRDEAWRCIAESLRRSGDPLCLRLAKEVEEHLRAPRACDHQGNPQRSILLHFFGDNAEACFRSAEAECEAQ